MDHEEENRNTNITYFHRLLSSRPQMNWICRAFSHRNEGTSQQTEGRRIIMWVCCHTHQASHKYQQQELLSWMLALAFFFIDQTESECICVQDGVLAYTRGAVEGLHMLLEGRADMRRFLPQLPFKKHIPLLPNSAKGVKGDSLHCFSFRWVAPPQIPIGHNLSFPLRIKTVINSSFLTMQGSGTV